MANVKKNATKKTATKKTASTRKTARKLVAKEVTRSEALEALAFRTFYVVSERKLFTWTPIVLFDNEDEARAYANELDEQSGVTFNKYKVDDVFLQYYGEPQEATSGIVGLDSVGAFNG